MQRCVVRRAIVNKLGCQEREGRKHTKYRFIEKGRCIAITHLPRERTIGDGLFSDIANQLYITSPQLQDIVDCTHEREGYMEMPKESPLLERAPGNLEEFLSGL